MTGYRGDVLVTVLRLDEFGQMNFPKIKISEVTDEDYVRIVIYLIEVSLTSKDVCRQVIIMVQLILLHYLTINI